MAERLSAENVALALLANTIATGATLVTLILTFGPISGAHFNPAVTLADASQGGLPWREVPAYLAAQLGGALIGVWSAHLMFAEQLLQVSERARAGGAQLFSEFVASFGLLSSSGDAFGSALTPCHLQLGCTSRAPIGLRRRHRLQTPR